MRTWVRFPSPPPDFAKASSGTASEDLRSLSAEALAKEDYAKATAGTASFFNGLAYKLKKLGLIA